LKNPLGQLLWEGSYRFHRKLDYLATLFPEARILVLGASNNEANALWKEIVRSFGKGTGLLSDWHLDWTRHCLVSTFRSVPKLRPGTWEIVVPVFRGEKPPSAATCQAVVRLQPRRLYTFVSRPEAFGQQVRLRLEAMSGLVIYPS